MLKPTTFVLAAAMSASLVAQAPLTGTWLFDEVSGLTAFDSGQFNPGRIEEAKASFILG